MTTVLAALWVSAGGAASQTASLVPRYRHIDPAATLPGELPQGVVRLLTDRDFAPYSFMAADGSQAGLSVDLAREVCAEMRMACELLPLPYAELLPALERGDGDAIVTGARLDAGLLQKADATRPYFLTTGRFLMNMEAKLPDASIRTLGGKRLGYVRGTLHGAFVEKYYARSALVPFDDAGAMYNALRDKQVDVIFGDGLLAAFWLRRPDAASCCTLLDGPFVDRRTFSRGLTLLARKDRKNLRETLDYALDRLEEKGVTAKVIARYMPGPVW